MFFPGISVGKEFYCNEGDVGLIPGSGRFTGGRQDNPFQCSCLENRMDRGAWWTTAHGFEKNQTLLSKFNTHSHSLQCSTDDPCFSMPSRGPAVLISPGSLPDLQSLVPHSRCTETPCAFCQGLQVILMP